MKRRAAFSLVEVVLAIGIVAFGLLVIFSMLGGALNINGDTAAQQESLSIGRAVPDFLRELGFDKISSQLGSGALTGYYGYTAATAGAPARAMIETAQTAARDAPNRTGKLFKLTFTLSPNLPIKVGGSYKAQPSASDYANEAVLPIQVRMEAVPNTTVAPAANNPAVFTYDVTLSR